MEEAVNGVFLLAYQVLTPWLLGALSVAAAASLAQSYYWLIRCQKMLQRPGALLALAAVFIGMAVFYGVIATASDPTIPAARGASRILWATLCAATIYNNSGAIGMTIDAVRNRQSKGK